MLGVGDAVALARDLVPQLDEGAHLADLGDEPQPRIDEEGDAADHVAEVCGLHLARGLDAIEHGLRGRERVGEFLHRRRARLLQMVGADVGRVPFLQFARGEDDGVLDQPQRRLGREDIGPAREVFLDDVVLDRAREFVAGRALLVGHGDIERQQPRGRRIDRHRSVHLVERDAGQERPHVADVGDRHADLADLAFGQLVVAVVARLGGQVEGDGKAGLALRQVLTIELVGLRRRGMAGVGAEDPGLFGRAAGSCWAALLLAHTSSFGQVGRAP